MRCTFLLHTTVLALCLGLPEAINGGTLRITPNTAIGWKAIEIISEGEHAENIFNLNYSMPPLFDGAGAYLVDANTLRIYVNHELFDATISEVDLNPTSLKAAISSVMNSESTAGITFVLSARQAYHRWSSDGGSKWTSTTSNNNTDFKWFCSAQTYPNNTFGPNRGFVDPIYITGEEDPNIPYARLFALDIVQRDLYQLSRMVGSAPGGIGGMPSDAWENAALLDTGETAHVALLLSTDGGTQRMRIYIGVKGKDQSGSNSTTFLARNGLAFGSWYYLKGKLPTTGTNSGTFSTSSNGALAASKFEDIDTNPNRPTQVVLGNQNYGVFVLDFSLRFTGTGGSFQATRSSFTIKRISTTSGGLGSLNAPDNVDWTRNTTLGDTMVYPSGLIFVNEDSTEGEIWQMNPDGTNKIKVGQTNIGAESTGIFDLSEFVGYKPASILITNNQGSTPTSSMTLLIHPNATTLM